MNSKLLLLAISVAALSSCSTVYKSGQTPDDVYFSPIRPYNDNVQEERDERRQEREVASNTNNDDRVIRLGINDRRYRYFDNDYRYNPYNYGFNHGYYYNPYFWPYPVYSPVFTAPSNPKNTTPRTRNLGGYGNVYNTNNTRVSPKTGTVQPSGNYNNNNNRTNNGSAFGNAIRKILTPASTDSYNNTNNNSNNKSSNNNRTYTPANNNNSGSSTNRSSGSSSSGSVSRPARGGGN